MINGEDKTDIDLAPMAMGAMTYGVTVRDLTQAYAAISNKGVFREARTYTQVLDSNDKVILDNRQERHVAISEKAAWYMTSLLQNAVTNGTGAYARLDGFDVAGKTGTSSGNNDRWFAGYTPYYTAAVWCGYDDPEEIVLVDSSTNPAAAMWKLVMERLHAGKEPAVFDTYGETATVTLCVDSGKMSVQACSRVVEGGKTSDRTSTVTLLAEDVGSWEQCDMHEMKLVCSETGKLATEYCAEMGAGVVERGVVVKDQNGKAIPMETCDVHTKWAWEASQEPDPSESGDPTDTTAPLNPTEPTETTGPLEPTEPTEPPNVAGGAANRSDSSTDITEHPSGPNTADEWTAEETQPESKVQPPRPEDTGLLPADGIGDFAATNRRRTRH